MSRSFSSYHLDTLLTQVYIAKHMVSPSETLPRRILLQSTAHETDIPQPNPTDKLREIIGDEGFTDIIVGDIKLRICDDEFFEKIHAAVPRVPVSFYSIWVLVGKPDSNMEREAKEFTEVIELCGGGCDCHTVFYVKNEEETTRFIPSEGNYRFVYKNPIGMSGYTCWGLGVRLGSDENTFGKMIVEKVLETKRRADAEPTVSSSPKPQD